MEEVDQQGRQIDGGKQQGGGPHRLPVHGKAKGDGEEEDLIEQQEDQLGQEDAQQQAPRDGDEAGVEGLPQHHQGDVPLGHAQDVVQADLLLPALHEEGVGVEEKDHRENPHHAGAQAHDGGDGGPAGHVVDLLVKGQEGHVVEHGHGDQAREQVGEHEAPVAHQVPGGHFGKEEVTHGLHPLWPGRSVCPQSG